MSPIFFTVVSRFIYLRTPIFYYDPECIVEIFEIKCVRFIPNRVNCDYILVFKLQKC